MPNVLKGSLASVLDDRLRQMFGNDSDPMEAVEARAQQLFAGKTVIAWECDATTFGFSWVSEAAERLLGHASDRWTREKAFWADQVVHPDDRADSIGYCALATAKAKDHIFEYRAVAADGRTLWLRDVVKVVLGPKGIALKLRGVMFDVTEEKRATTPASAFQQPTREELQASN